MSNSQNSESLMWNSSGRDSPMAEPHYPMATNSPFSVSDIFIALRRGAVLMFLGSLIGLAAALFYTSVVPDLYKSTARILIDRSVNRYLQNNNLIDEPTFDDNEVSSQIYVVSSENVIVPVVRSLKLTQDPEFNGKPGEQAGPLGKLRIVEFFKNLLPPPAVDPSIDAETVLERVAVETIQKRLTVNREDVANVINVTVASVNPKKAATIANALAEGYLANTRENKERTNRIAVQLIEERLAELKEQSQNADRTLQEYKTSMDDGAPTSEQLSGLLRELTNARVAVAEAKARLASVEKITGNDPAKEALLDSETIRRLRQQHQEVSSRAIELESRVGPKHAAVVKLRKQMKALEDARQQEELRVTDFYANDYKIANARKSELTAALAELDKEAESGSEAQVTLRELELSAETLRRLYNGFLQKFNEVNKAQAQETPVLDARVITPAAPALQKSSKKQIAIIAAGMLAGLMMGAAGAVAREWAVDVFRTPDQLRRKLNVYAVATPFVKLRRRLFGRFRKGSPDASPLERIIRETPYPLVTDAARSIKSLMSVAQRDDDQKVFCVVSAAEKEGKSTLVTSLAALMAASAKSRTLVIDADLYLRHLTINLAPNATEGLLEALVDPTRLATVVSKWHDSNVDILPCVLTSRITDSGEIVGSLQMEALLDAARDIYDFIIIEVPPILASSDVMLIERFVDRFILVVEAGKTKRRLVEEALSEAEVIGDRLICVVLNKADPSAIRTSTYTYAAATA